MESKMEPISRGACILLAAILASCTTQSAPWQNANPNASLNTDVQRCRKLTGGLPPQLMSDSCVKGSGNCVSAGPLPQDVVARQTGDYEACLAKLGWYR